MAFGWARIRRKESPQSRDPLVQARVIRRIGNSIRRRDRVERIGPNRGSFLRKLCRPHALDLARQVGPGSPRQQRLIGLLLRLAELEPYGEPVGPGRVFLNVELEDSRRRGRDCQPPCWRGPSRRASTARSGGLSASSRACTSSSYAAFGSEAISGSPGSSNRRA